jgi:3-methyladenine DNA glycosylase AlkD
MDLSRSSTAEEIIAHLKAIGTDIARQGMARYGIDIGAALGVPHATLRPLQKVLKRDHTRALALWASGIREARMLASMTDDPHQMTLEQCRSWAADFNSWDIVDGVADLFADTSFRQQLIAEFAADEREFVRRAAFATMAWMNLGRRKVPEDVRLAFLPLIERHATDERNFVKKAVNWALRQTGKSSVALHGPALALATQLAVSDDKTARWIGKDAVRELTDPKILARIQAKG